MKEEYKKLVGELGGEKIKLNEPLAKYTTFKIGGPADLFLEVKTKDELVQAVGTARKLKVEYFILGGGSNILVSDRGFKGLAVKVNTFGCTVKENFLLAEAGTPSSYVLKTALDNNLTGMEFLSGVPGTIGGAVACNVRAFFLGNFLTEPRCVGDVLSSVEVLNENGEIKNNTAKRYSYSIFASTIKDSGEVILAVEFELKEGVPKTAWQYLEDYRVFRQDKPYNKYPTPGSIFQNTEGKSSGWLIDQCGLKGYIIGKAKISEKHANFIVNTGGAKASEVSALIELAKEKVREKFNLELKEEIIRIGEF